MKPLALLLSLVLCTAAAAAEKPNIVVILVDDMGFSDLGCFGSEIPTPNLDALAAGGLRFSQFYNTSRCCPTRAALLTGVYSHQAGVGHMVEDAGEAYPGFRGHLMDRVVTIPEVLQPAGYFTAMTGKWHVGHPIATPVNRGFMRSLYAAHGGFYYDHSADPRKIELFLNGETLQPTSDRLPKNWYSTDLWTDYGLRFIDEASEAKKPFFLYLAHNAPHFPLQAGPEDIAKFRGRYKDGWDKLAAARHARQKELGVVDAAWPATPRPPQIPAWDSLSEEKKDYYDNLMAIYAACVWRMDRAIGTLVEGLKKRGVFENTLILFMSDNGGNAEAGITGTAKGPGPLGSADSTVFAGECWAWMENTPFRQYKHYSHEGGISSSFIAHWPAGIAARGEWRREPAHLIDVMATCADLGGAEYPKERDGKAIIPRQGVSLRPAFTSQPLGRTTPLFFEHEGNAAVRDGDLKAVRRGYNGAWELYDMKADRTEQHDLAAEKTAEVQSFAAKWEDWAAKSFVKPWPGGGAKKAKGKAASRLELKPGAELQGDDAPDVAEKAFKISVKLAKPGTTGVLAAQGGSNLGWTLFCQEGRLHFVLNRAGKRTGLSTDLAATATAKEITAIIGPKGVARLLADGKELAREKLDGLLPDQPADGLQVGQDSSGTVGEYKAPFAYDGVIESAMLEITPPAK